MPGRIQYLHTKAEKLREEDKLLEALKTYEEVIALYQEQKNYAGMIEAIMGRCLTYKHLYLVTDDKSFAIIARNTALSALEIAQEKNMADKIYRCNFRMGEMEMLFDDFKKATQYYEKALSDYPVDEAEKGDFQYHLGEAQYKAGLTEAGKKNMLEGLAKIEEHEDTTDSFAYHVWRSGGYMRLAEALWNDSPEEARQYLKIAGDIIDSDERLIIRKRQVRELKEKLHGGVSR